MQFEFIWEPSLVICRLSGRVKPEDFVVSTQAMISSPKFRPEMDKVTDLTESTYPPSPALTSSG